MWTKLKTQSQILLQVKGPGFFRLNHHQRCPARVSRKYFSSILYAFNQIPRIKLDFLHQNQNDIALSIYSGGVSPISYSPLSVNHTNSPPLLPSYPDRRLDGFMVESLHWIQAYIIIFVTDFLCSLGQIISLFFRW